MTQSDQAAVRKDAPTLTTRLPLQYIARYHEILMNTCRNKALPADVGRLRTYEFFANLQAKERLNHPSLHPKRLSVWRRGRVGGVESEPVKVQLSSVSLPWPLPVAQAPALSAVSARLNHAAFHCRALRFPRPGGCAGYPSPILRGSRGNLHK